ncbi:FAD-dependent oxidoreductase [Paenibacillus filicis]|uniref:FAD-dependent oxidoreductase n=1 Tax=Paenibacillus filicis TaxID=669464 RepID=A0ABU9DJM4_9BACL
MNLTSGQLYWVDIQKSLKPEYPKLEEDISCECLVIGGGVAGASCAYALQKAGVDTVLIDKRRIGFGSTSANTGLLQFSNDKMLTSCIHTFGEQSGVGFYRMCLEALNDLEAVIAELDLFPDFYRRDSLYYASHPMDEAKLRDEFAALSAYGFPVSYLDSAELRTRFSFEKAGAILSRDNAEINPFAYARSLTFTASRRGIRVFEHTEVQSHTAGQDGISFLTTDGKTIKAKKAVLTMGYESQEIKHNPNAVLTSTYVIATEPIPGGDIAGWSDRCLIWETAKPSLYLRRTADNRVVVGGLDINGIEPAERDRRLKAKGEKLLAETIKLFPALEGTRIDYAWAATFGSTHDGLPLIGEQEGFPHCYFALVYGGNGTIYSAIASRIVTGLVKDGKHPDAALFRFDRPTRSMSSSGAEPS